MSYSHTFNANTWYHIVMVEVNSTKQRFLYVNGVLVQNDTATYVTTTTNSGTLQIGRMFNRNGENWNGYIDDFMLFNSSLNSSQVLDILQRLYRR